MLEMPISNYHILLSTKGPKSSSFPDLSCQSNPPKSTQLDVQQCVGLRPLGASPLLNATETSLMSEAKRPPWQPLP
jgi:hypothetical protein